MRKTKTVTQVLLIASVLIALCHLSYSGTPAVRKKAHASKESKRKTVRKESKTRKRSRAAAASRVNNLVYTVTATTYQAVASQTDSKPFVTADNTIIRRGYSSRLHWLAVSRDLLKQGGGRIHYGDKVRVRGVSPKLDGVYTVHDTMHKRHRRRIDILSSPREKLTLATKGVELQVIKPVATRKEPAKPAKLAASHTKRSQHVASRPVHGRSQPRAGRPTYLAAAIL